MTAPKPKPSPPDAQPALLAALKHALAALEHEHPDCVGESGYSASIDGGPEMDVDLSMIRAALQMNPTETKPSPPDAHHAALIAERDGYRQALETEKALRAADVRELRAALERIAEYLRQGRAALQMANESRGAK